MIKNQISISTLEELEAFATTFAAMLKGGETIGLVGELGAGKTTFVKKLVKVLGSNEDQVTSPTYVLQHEYSTNNFIVEHWDLYRLETLPREINEIVSHKKIILLEWSNKFDIDLDVTLNFQSVSEHKRIVNMLSGRAKQ